MTIAFAAYITVGKEDYDYITKYVKTDHDLTKEDLEEFVKEQGYNSVKDYFMTYIEQGSEEENIAYYNEFIAPYTETNCDLLTTEIEITCKNKNELINFLVGKYQSKFNTKLLEKLNETDLTFDLD